MKLVLLFSTVSKREGLRKLYFLDFISFLENVYFAIRLTHKVF